MQLDNSKKVNEKALQQSIDLYALHFPPRVKEIASLDKSKVNYDQFELLQSTNEQPEWFLVKFKHEKSFYKQSRYWETGVYKSLGLSLVSQIWLNADFENIIQISTFYYY